MIAFHDVASGIKSLALESHLPVIAHISDSSLDEIKGGADTVLGALLGAVDTLMMPSFTLKCMIIPQAGPVDNALNYGSGNENNSLAEFFTPRLPSDSLMGVAAERLRLMPEAVRSNHPLLSFAGIGVDAAIKTQTLNNPLAPLQALGDLGASILLFGVDQSANFSIHLAEKLAGRKQFIRWALTPAGVLECPGFPGCNHGFNQASRLTEPVSRQMLIGTSTIKVIPLLPMVQILQQKILKDPEFLLCDRSDCDFCTAIRTSLS